MGVCLELVRTDFSQGHQPIFQNILGVAKLFVLYVDYVYIFQKFWNHGCMDSVKGSNLPHTQQ